MAPVAQTYDLGKAVLTHAKHGNKDQLSQLEIRMVQGLFTYLHSVLVAAKHAGETARSDTYARAKSL